MIEQTTSASTHPLLRVAAAPTLERIRQDRQKAGPRIRPLLTILEERLFVSELDVQQLRRWCNVRDNSVLLLFHSEVGKTPKAYITDRRLETAARLLVDTRLKIWKIADLVGYSSIGVFSAAFTRWAGVRPNFYRRSRASHPPEAGQSFVHWSNDPAFLQNALAGLLPPDLASSLIHRLRQIYCPHSSQLAKGGA